VRLGTASDIADRTYSRKRPGLDREAAMNTDTEPLRAARPPRHFDYKHAHYLALETVGQWAPALLGRRIVVFAPGEAAWWPHRCDGVHVFLGPPAVAIGDWSGRWRRGETWGLDLIALIARRRGCRPGQAFAWTCRLAGVPIEALMLPTSGRRAA
jgi:hypothetical protein